MANRVEYIKIARVDQNGNDNTITLESLTQLTIPYSNGNNAVYPIESITRRRDFFLYQVGPANYTPNPNDSGSLLYDFTGSLGGANTIFFNSDFFIFMLYLLLLMLFYIHQLVFLF